MEELRLKGIRNLRDLGGLPVKGGKVRSRRFYRSGKLSGASDKAVAMLRDILGVRIIIDLRTANECLEKPNPPIQGTQVLHFSLMEQAQAGVTHEKGDEAALLERMPDMDGIYRKMAGETQTLSEIMGRIVSMNDAQYPLLFHCTEGKDRTGIVAMLILALLGASKETIMADYLRTNRANVWRLHKYALFLRLKGRRAAAKGMWAAYLAKAEYLNAAWKAIEDKWGSMDAFLRDGLHISDEARAAFCRANVVMC